MLVSTLNPFLNISSRRIISKATYQSVTAQVRAKMISSLTKEKFIIRETVTPSKRILQAIFLKEFKKNKIKEIVKASVSSPKQTKRAYKIDSAKSINLKELERQLQKARIPMFEFENPQDYLTEKAFAELQKSHRSL